MEEQEFKVYISSITFNDSNTFNFDDSDIIVFTGANNTGKSQVLKDIEDHYSTPDMSPIVISNIEDKINGSTESILKHCLINNEGNVYFDNEFISSTEHIDFLIRQRDFKKLYKIFLKRLSTASRLNGANKVASFDVLKQQPSNPIQHLYNNDELEGSISRLFAQAFSQHLIVNRGAGKSIYLHVGNKPEIHEGEDRVSRTYLERLNKLPALEDQGDGMKSYASILLHTFTSNETITLIDEPEAFLHPPQARLLGKMLVKNTPNDRQLFISTHSEEFLKGILDTDSSRVKIVRITRDGSINHMKMLDNSEIKSIWEDPILRFSNILSGLYHSKVVVCEADTDCLFYQSILYSLHQGEEDIAPDIMFTHCGGKQRLKVIVKALRSLNVKTAIITDIDILNNKDTFKDLIETCGISWDDISSNWNKLNEYCKKQRPQLETKEVKKDILVSLEKVNGEILEKENVEELRKIIKQSTAWSKIKETGKTFFIGDAYRAFNEIEKLCSQMGLFIVPVGELECFYKLISGHGTLWVNKVLAEVDLKNEPELEDARTFIKRIEDF